MPESPFSVEDRDLICASIEKTLAGPLLTSRNSTITSLRHDNVVLKQENAQIKRDNVQLKAAAKLSDSALDAANSENTRLCREALEKERTLTGVSLGELRDGVLEKGYRVIDTVALDSILNGETSTEIFERIRSIRNQEWIEPGAPVKLPPAPVLPPGCTDR